MAVHFSLRSFPHDAAAKEALGMPWGCTVQPFAFAADQLDRTKLP